MGCHKVHVIGLWICLIHLYFISGVIFFSFDSPSSYSGGAQIVTPKKCLIKQFLLEIRGLKYPSFFHFSISLFIFLFLSLDFSNPLSHKRPLLSFSSHSLSPQKQAPLPPDHSPPAHLPPLQPRLTTPHAPSSSPSHPRGPRSASPSQPRYIHLHPCGHIWASSTSSSRPCPPTPRQKGTSLHADRGSRKKLPISASASVGRMSQWIFESSTWGAPRFWVVWWIKHAKQFLELIKL